MSARARLTTTGTALSLTLLLAASAAGAAETDPYYAWVRPPRDSTAALNRAVNRLLQSAIDEVNGSWGWAELTCPDVTARMAIPLVRTGMWFFVGAMDGNELDYTPRTNTEYVEHHRPRSIYRDGFWWRLGFLVPPDPTLRIADVHLSFDKLGHFFIDGHDYYVVFHDALARGLSEEAARQTAIVEQGVRAETYIQGNAISGVFSFADLEANWQGFLFYRALCDGEAPLLVKDGAGWRMREPLDLRDYVNPCWDESYYASSFDPRVGVGVKRALRAYCAVVDEPYVAALRRRYRERGCGSDSYRFLEKLAARGRIPDRTQYTIDAVCAEAADDER